MNVLRTKQTQKHFFLNFILYSSQWIYADSKIRTSNQWIINFTLYPLIIVMLSIIRTQFSGFVLVLSKFQHKQSNVQNRCKNHKRFLRFLCVKRFHMISEVENWLSLMLDATVPYIYLHCSILTPYKIWFWIKISKINHR